MFMPTVLRPQYDAIINPTLNEDSPTWDGFGIVISYASALLTKTGGRVRVYVIPPSIGANLVLASGYIGMANTAPSFDGNQVQLLRESDGAPGVTLTAGGSPVPLIASFRPILTGTLLIAFGVTSGDLRRNVGLSADYSFYSKGADAANAGTTTKSGYSLVANRSDVVSKIEILN